MKSCCVIGLGYIGLPTALLFAEAGIKVLGVDINSKIINNLKQYKLHINEPKIDKLLKSSLENKNLELGKKPSFSDVFIITVPTPFLKGDDVNIPDLEYVYSAVDSIIPFIKKGNLIILESTSPVGTTENIAKKILNEKDFNLDDIYIGYCPERVLPGNIIYELKNNERIIGGINKTSSEKIKDFYKIICKANISSTNSRTAELAKLTENAYRDINIAFANELSFITDKLDINVYELISLTNNHPRVNILKPGCGVGGHCIAVDPWFLISQFPVESKLMQLSREVNNLKPLWIINKIEDYLTKLSNQSNLKLGIFGMTFKPNVNDIRESPALQIINYLRNKYEVIVCDPNIKNHNTFKINSIDYTIENSDLLVFLVGHKEFKEVNKKNKTYFDFCGIFTD